MTKKEAEQRLEQLEKSSAVTGEEGVEDQMLIKDEIRALKEGLKSVSDIVDKKKVMTPEEINAEVKKRQDELDNMKDIRAKAQIQKKAEDIAMQGKTIRQAYFDSAIESIGIGRDDFKGWIKSIDSLSTLEKLFSDLEVNFEGIKVSEREAESMRDLFNEIALRYQRGSEDIRSNLELFGKNKKRIKFTTNTKAILMNARKDLLGNQPAKVMISELLQNSFDAGASEVIVDIRIKEDAIVLKFADNGSGMTAEEVEKNLFVYGNRSKGEYDAGSYGQAKAAFMLHPNKFKLTTIKDGKRTEVEGTSSALLEGDVSLSTTNSQAKNQTFFEFEITKEWRAETEDYYKALKGLISKIKKPIKAKVTWEKERLFKDNIILDEVLTPTLDENYAHPPINLEYKGNEIEITFDRTEKYGYNILGGYEIEVSTLNKGLPLPELSRSFSFKVKQKPDFKVNVNFKKTTLVDSKDYPFIRNRSDYNKEIFNKVESEISKVIEEERKRQLDLSVKELQDSINNAPIFGGTKVILPEIVDEKDLVDIKALLAKETPFLESIGKSFAHFNKLVTEAGFKAVELVITLDPTVHGFRPNVEIFGGKEVYAINPFAMEKEQLIYMIKMELMENSDLTKKLTDDHDKLVEFEEKIKSDKWLDYLDVAEKLNRFSDIDMYNELKALLKAESLGFSSKDEALSAIGRRIGQIEDQLSDFMAEEAENKFKSASAEYRARVFVHTMVHEFAHKWGRGHDAEFASKVNEIYMKIGHKKLSILEDELIELFANTGDNYEQIQEEIQSIYDKVDKVSVSFREELAVESHQKGAGREKYSEEYNGPRESAQRSVEEIVAHTRSWHKVRLLYKQAWDRVQVLVKAQENNYSSKVAMEDFIQMMRDKLPIQFQESFFNWSMEFFDINKMKGWTKIGKEDGASMFVDALDADDLINITLNEIREGLDTVYSNASDFRYLNNLNSKIDKALGIVIDIETAIKWHSSIHKFNNAQDWISNTLEEFTGLKLKSLSKPQYNMLKTKYHALKNNIRVNRTKDEDNQRSNIIAQTTGNRIILKHKTETNVVTNKENPKMDTNFIAGEDKNLVWLRVSDILDRYSEDSWGPRPISKWKERFSALDMEDLKLLSDTLLNSNMVIAFIRGESALGLAKITREDMSLASNEDALIRFWKNEGLNQSQINNLLEYPGLDARGVKWRAGRVRVYKVLKKYYPEFDKDDLDNVFKRLKIPFTPTVKLEGFRDVKIKLVNKEKLSFVSGDGTEVKAWQDIGELNSIYVGDGGSLMSAHTFKDINSHAGFHYNSAKSKSVMYQVDKDGSFFVKHLGYIPKHGLAFGETINIYENYGAPNEKYIGYIDTDGNIFASPVPTKWTQKALDDYISEHKLTEKSGTELLSFFTDDNGGGIDGINNAAIKILEGANFKEDVSLKDRLEYIASKEVWLRLFVKRVANQANVTEAEKKSVELVDYIMTDDEAKVFTKEYEIYKKNGQTFTIKGDSIGFLTSTDKVHNDPSFAEQLLNFIDDEYVSGLIVDHLLPTIRNKTGSILELAHGKADSVQKKIAAFASYLSKSVKNFDAIDTVMKDAFELGLGLHPTSLELLETNTQSSFIRTALKLKGVGAIEEIQWDMTGKLEENEVSISSKNAGFVYSVYSQATGISLETAKRNSHLEKVNEWLVENDVYVLGYRSPIPHVNGAAMLRIHSLHTSKDIVFMNPHTIFRRFEGDGDGDKLQMSYLGDNPVLNDALIEYFDKPEIKAKIRGVNLKKIAERYRTEKLDWTNSRHIAGLISALTRGNQAISEIAKTQRIYGQLRTVFNSITYRNQNTNQLIKIKLRKPTDLYAKSKSLFFQDYNIEESLRIYLQAAVDNGKYLLLDKINYDKETLHSDLFYAELPDGSKRELNVNEYVVIKPLFTLHGRTGSIRDGRSMEKKFNLTEQLQASREYLEYVQDRKGMYLATLMEQRYIADVIDAEFKEGAIHAQERFIIEPVRVYNEAETANEDGSPFRLIGWNDTDNVTPNIYMQAHDDAIHYIQEDKLDLPVTQKDIDDGTKYAYAMGTAFYRMYSQFKGTGPGFLGWRNNEIMVNFAEKYAKQFKELSSEAQQVATYLFMEGIPIVRGRTITNVRYVRQLPPISRSISGITLLDADIMEKYLKRYNEVLMDKNNRSAPAVRDKVDFKGFSIVDELKNGCK